jgi:4-carboxymuconolactone decarboxylase
MGDYLRFNSAIGTTLSELAILMTAREWSQDYEWLIHAPIAEKAGISREIIDAIHDGRRPEKMSDDEAIIYDFSTELLRTRRVSDPTFARMDKRFGKKGVIDLTGIHGYYGLLAMQMNVARYVPPQAMPRLKRFPE